MKKPFAITLDIASSLANHTGSWRTQRPVYVHRIPPCNDACPAGENVQGWLNRAEEGDYEGAWRLLVRDNPMPAVHGRVCYHPCESACNRGQMDTTVSIHAVERFLGDEALRQGWNLEPGAPTGKKILVIGAGPSGLSAAWHLRLKGHDVDVYDAGPKAGGMMRFGIPRYRLPREVLDSEIQRIENLGVRFIFNTKVDDIERLMKDDGYDAAFVAIGAHLARRTDIPARDASRILDAISVLHDVEDGKTPPLMGRKVVVYGGGNTALDTARTARRLGASEAVIVYRRTKEQMPAHESEMQEAVEEGVMFNWLRTIKKMDEGAITIEKMKLNEDGWPEPTGEFETIEADTVILALGQQTDSSFLQKLDGVEFDRNGVVKVDSSMMTGHPGVFAGGDMVPSERTVTVATGHGKQAARHIDAWVKGETWRPGERHPLATYDRLNTWYYTDAPATIQPELDLARRQSTFDEVVQGLDETNALFEARRCLSCGNCFECDNCYGVCPDNAVRKLGPGKGYEFDYDFCKGCGLCAEECPCGAIDMVPEQA